MITAPECGLVTILGHGGSGKTRIALQAASWVRTIPCSELERELKKSLEMLESSGTHRPGRQQSFQAVFDYSWDLLSSKEQNVLAGLPFFREDLAEKQPQLLQTAV